MRLHLQTGSKEDAIGALYGDRLRVRVKARAVEGQANKQLINFLAREFGVNKSKVMIVNGLHSRDKTVAICNPDKNPAWFQALSNEKAG